MAINYAIRWCWHRYHYIFYWHNKVVPKIINLIVLNWYLFWFFTLRDNVFFTNWGEKVKIWYYTLGTNGNLAFSVVLTTVVQCVRVNCGLFVMINSLYCMELWMSCLHHMCISVWFREMLLMKWKLNKYFMMLQLCHFLRGVILPMFRFEGLSLCTGLKIFQLWCLSHP